MWAATGGVAIALAVVLAPPAAAASDDLTLASTSDSGVNSDRFSKLPSLSAEGSTVAFESEATNLDPADSDMIRDIYVKDLVSGDIILASTSDTGVKGNGESRNATLSADGTTVAFESKATNLDPADTDVRWDVYVKDVTGGDIALASTSDIGIKGNDDSAEPSLSADGSTVAFNSYANNLDPADLDFGWDVYVKDLASGDIMVASTSNTGTKGNYPSGAHLSLSADAGRVAFFSLASNLHPWDNDTVGDVYVKDLVTGEIVLASTSDDGVKGNAGSGQPTLSADGSTVAFMSMATNLDPGDTDSYYDIYVKDVDGWEIQLASTSDEDVKSNNVNWSPDLSADGTTVAFQSGATNLDPADTSTNWDVYVKDLASGDILLASTADDGTHGNGISLSASMSANGSTVAFYSTSPLDEADTDSDDDVYVRNAPAPPAALDDAYNATEDTTLNVPAPGVLGNDTDANGDQLSAHLVGGPSNGDLSLALDGAFTYVPDPGFLGTDAFTYTASDGLLSSGPATVTIRVYAAPPELSIRDRSKDEGDGGVTKFKLRVTLNEASAGEVLVDYSTRDGTAVAPADYRALSGTLFFAPGQTTASIVVRVLGETLVERDEWFAVELSNPERAVIIDGLARATIRNDD